MPGTFPAPGKELAPDRSRKPEVTKFINDGRLDVNDVNKDWMQEFMKEHNLSQKDVSLGG